MNGRSNKPSGKRCPSTGQQGDDAGNHKEVTRAVSMTRAASFAKRPVSITPSVFRLPAVKMTSFRLTKTD